MRLFTRMMIPLTVVIGAAIPRTAFEQVDFAQFDQLGHESETEASTALDEHVLSRLHAVNQLEIALARMAVQSTRSADVRDFAQMMLGDHTKADRQLVDYCSRTRLNLGRFVPTTPEELNDDRKDQETLSHLAHLQGPEFDRLYISANADDHLIIYEWLRAREHSLSTGPMNQVETQLPVILHHYQMAEALKARF